MGLPGYLPGCFPVLPGWGVRCSRSYREGGQRTSLPIGPATATEPGRSERQAPRLEPGDHGTCRDGLTMSAHRDKAGGLQKGGDFRFWTREADARSRGLGRPSVDLGQRQRSFGAHAMFSRT